MVAVIFDVLFAYLIAEKLNRIWVQIQLLLIASTIASCIGAYTAYLLSDGLISGREAAVSAISGLLLNITITAVTFIYFRKRKSESTEKSASTAQ
ncbi:hypothetical protein [Amphritea sp. HPY]|uniref:hypothetical protein n=1 Tax=Amphritea sp. HPY TaxID=3421652 RepID=UPI003D7CDF8A